jgi:excisionase family DNA binding protein
MALESFYTIEEVADHLRVPVDLLKKEVQQGRLRAWTLDKFTRIREADLEAYLNSSAGANQSSTTNASGGPSLTAAQDFTFTWPDGKVEHFTGVREGIISYAGREYHVRLGFTNRNSAGKLRKRSLVLVDRYATVEFVAPDTTADGMMASIIKDRNGKQLPVGAAIPKEYARLRTGAYRDVVNGPGASNGLAVICDAADYSTMVTHALIRYKYRQERKPN